MIAWTPPGSEGDIVTLSRVPLIALLGRRHGGSSHCWGVAFRSWREPCDVARDSGRTLLVITRVVDETVAGLQEAQGGQISVSVTVGGTKNKQQKGPPSPPLSLELAALSSLVPLGTAHHCSNRMVHTQEGHSPISPLEAGRDRCERPGGARGG